MLLYWLFYSAVNCDSSNHNSAVVLLFGVFFSLWCYIRFMKLFFSFVLIPDFHSNLMNNLIFWFAPIKLMIMKQGNQGIPSTFYRIKCFFFQYFIHKIIPKLIGNWHIIYIYITTVVLCPI